MGSVQFGLRYGLTNRCGKVSLEAASQIINLARAHRVDTIDTAIAYGDSESCLGAVGVEDFRVVTKIPGIPEFVERTRIGAWLTREVEASLARLRIPRLYGLLLHRPEDLNSSRGDELYKELVLLRSAGYVERIGVSVYGPDELQSLPSHFQFGLVQAPFNVLDRRIVTSGAVARLKDQGTEIHIRSVLLQGLLAMPLIDIPPAFHQWIELFEDWNAWLRAERVGPVAAAVSFAVAASGADRIVVGVDSVDQLREILSAACSPSVLPPASLQSEDPDLINPSRWRLT